MQQLKQRRPQYSTSIPTFRPQIQPIYVGFFVYKTKARAPLKTATKAMKAGFLIDELLSTYGGGTTGVVELSDGQVPLP